MNAAARRVRPALTRCWTTRTSAIGHWFWSPRTKNSRTCSVTGAHRCPSPPAGLLLRYIFVFTAKKQSSIESSEFQNPKDDKHARRKKKKQKKQSRRKIRRLLSQNRAEGGMERDFLGTHAKTYHPDAAKGDAGPSLQWPFSNKVSAMQQFMLYKPSQVETPRSHALRSQHLPKVAVFEPNHGAHHASASQNFPGQHSIHGSFGPSSHLLTIPFARNPYFKVQNAHNHAPNSALKSTNRLPFVGGGAEVGSFGHRSMAKQNHKAAAQLTIFYGGCVNVFDDVPFDKAQAVMSSLANPVPIVASHGKKIRSQASRPISNSLSPKQSSVSTASNTVGSRGRGSKINNATTGLKLVVHPIPRAIPQARKASLARFLERRKERLTSAVPYASAKIYTENDRGHNASSTTNSSADTNLSSYQMASSFAGHLLKNSMDALSIKLTI